MFMYLLETANIMFLSLIRFELLSFHITQNVKYNSVALLLGYNQDIFHPEVLDIFPFIFHILSISRNPRLFSWERLDSLIFVCTP